MQLTCFYFLRLEFWFWQKKNWWTQPTNFSLHQFNSFFLDVESREYSIFKIHWSKNMIFVYFTQWLQFNKTSFQPTVFLGFSLLFTWMVFISSNKLLCSALSKILFQKGFSSKEQQRPFIFLWTRIYLWLCDYILWVVVCLYVCE